MLSIPIISLALSYFIYLFYSWLNGGFPPSIVNYQLYNKNDIKFSEIVYKNSPFIYLYLIIIILI